MKDKTPLEALEYAQHLAEQELITLRNQCKDIYPELDSIGVRFTRPSFDDGDIPTTRMSILIDQESDDHYNLKENYKLECAFELLERSPLLKAAWTGTYDAETVALLLGQGMDTDHRANMIVTCDESGITRVKCNEW